MQKKGLIFFFTLFSLAEPSLPLFSDLSFCCLSLALSSMHVGAVFFNYNELFISTRTPRALLSRGAFFRYARFGYAPFSVHSFVLFTLLHPSSLAGSPSNRSSPLGARWKKILIGTVKFTEEKFDSIFTTVIQRTVKLTAVKMSNFLQLCTLHQA